jgi:hypothetical protein
LKADCSASVTLSALDRARRDDAVDLDQRGVLAAFASPPLPVHRHHDHTVM